MAVQGLKPLFKFGALYAALKRRSSTVVPSVSMSAKENNGILTSHVCWCS
jgi:hypothetical protein